LSRSKW